MESTGPRQALRALTPELTEAGVGAVINAWINECGGALLLEIERELQEQAKGLAIQTDPESHHATSRIFQEAGMTELEHLMWRETRMRTACQVEYISMVTTMNSTFVADGDEMTAGVRPYKVPSVTRKQLEAAVAKEYVKNKAKYVQTKEPHAEEKTTTEEAESDAGQTGDETTASRALTHGDLEDEELEAKQVVERQLVIKMSSSNDEDQEEEKVKLLGNLRQAAYRVLKDKEQGRLDPPVRVSKTGNGYWWNIAIAIKGPGGREGGNKYKFIRQGAPEQESL
jgi:hypothetical protein